MLVRRPDWAPALECFLKETSERRFRYGSFDCCLFVCDAIQVMTGVDPAAPFRGTYDSRRAAFRVMRTNGARSVREMVTRIAEIETMPEILIKRAGRGDVALVRRRGDCSLAIVSLAGSDLLCVGARDLLRMPLANAERAWKV